MSLGNRRSRCPIPTRRASSGAKMKYAPPSLAGSRAACRSGPSRARTDADHDEDLTLDLSAVTVFASGLLLHLAMCVTGIRADFARYETRPLTDPHDWSARWSYLTVLVRVDDLDGPADSLHPTEPRSDDPGPYRTTPLYWIGTYPRAGSLIVTTSWTEIGLHPTSLTLALGRSPSPPPPNPTRDGNTHSAPPNISISGNRTRGSETSSPSVRSQPRRHKGKSSAETCSCRALPGGQSSSWTTAKNTISTSSERD